MGSLSEKELRVRRSGIGMIFQHFNLLMQKSVLDNICFPLQITGVKKKEAVQRVAIIENGVLVEHGEVEEIFNHPKSRAARELILKAAGRIEKGVLKEVLREDKKLRIVFTENSAFEPVIANMVLKFQTPVNILRADTKNVGGVAKGEMILGLPKDRHLQLDIEQYLLERGLEIEEVTGDVE